MIIQIQPDIQKSRSLVRMAKITLERLQNTDMEKYPTNTLTDYYDVIHKLLEAITLIGGIKIKGEGAHKELIEYVTKKISFDEQTRQFLQQMREYRNRISYEGFMIHTNYFKHNKEKINQIIQTLFQKLEL